MPGNNGDPDASEPDPSTNGSTALPVDAATHQAPTPPAASLVAGATLPPPVLLSAEPSTAAPSPIHAWRRAGSQSSSEDGAAAPDTWGRLVRWWDERRSARERKREQEVSQSSVIVDRDDDLATICGRLDTARSAQVIVVIPKGNAELSRPLGVRLLMRHALLTGKEIVLVTRNFSIRQRAQAEGLAHTASVRRARFGKQAAPLQLGGLDLALPGLGALVTAAALGLFLAAAYVALFWYLPVATITLYPRSTVATREQALTIDAQTSRLNTAGMVVPAARRQTSVSRTVFIPASGSIPLDQGGTAPAVSERDLKLAQDLASQALSEQVLVDLRARYGASETLFPESSQVQVFSVDTRQKAGDSASFLEVTYRGSGSMLAAKTGDLHQLFAGLLRSQIQGDQELIDSSFHLMVLSAGPYDKGTEKLPAQVQSRVSVAPALNKSSLRQSLAGKSRGEAARYLDRAFSPAQAAEIAVSPGWAPWLPRAGQHLHIEIRAAGSTR